MTHAAPMLVDSHCHLDFPEFQEDMEGVMARAEENGIGIMQTICTRVTEFPKIRAIAERYNHVYCSVGIHPHNVEEQPKVTAAEIVELTQHPKVIGIGETGLDFFYDHSPRDLQEQSFRQHIAASRETKLPLIVHTRNADEKTIEILADEMKKGAFPGLIHCFSTGRALAEASIAHGFFISLSGILTFKKAQELQETVKHLPLSSLLLETDAPFLAPIPHRGKRNEPAFTRHTAEFLAELKGVTYEEVAKVTTDNFFKLFTKVKHR